MTTLRVALANSNHPTIVGMLAQKREQDESRSRFVAQKQAKRMRDEAIARIHSLSYSRKRKDGGGILVPRRKEDRKALHEAMRAASVYAALARPDNGYPAPQFRRDPEYPSGALMRDDKNTTDFNNLVAERNRLVFWLSVLESRKESMTVLERVASHISRLNSKIAFMSKNEHIRRIPGTKTYTLRPAPRAFVGQVQTTVQYVRTFN